MSTAGQGREVIKISLLRAGKVIRTYQVRSDTLTIGSAKDCDIRAAGDTSLAPLHATLYIDEDGALVLVPEAGASVLLNGERVDFASPRSDDEIRAGRLTFKVERGESPASVVPPPALPQTEVLNTVSAAPAEDLSPLPEPPPAEIDEFEEEVPPPDEETDLAAPDSAFDTAAWDIEVDLDAEMQGASLSESPEPPVRTASVPEVLFDERNIEDASRYTTEVITLWWNTVLQFKIAEAGSARPCSFHVGEDAACDFPIPSGLLNGSTRLPLAFGCGRGAWITIPPDPRGDVTFEDGSRVSLADLVSTGQAKPSGKPRGCHSFALPPRARAKIDIGDFVFLVNSVPRSQKLASSGRSSSSAIPFFFVSLLLHCMVIVLALLDVSSLSGISFGMEEANRKVRYDLTPIELQEKREEKKHEQKKEVRKRKEQKNDAAKRDANRSERYANGRIPDAPQVAVRNILSILSRGKDKEIELNVDPKIPGKTSFSLAGAIANLPGEEVDVSRRGAVVATMSGEEVAGKGSGIAKLVRSERRGPVRGKVTKMSSGATIKGELSREEVLKVINAHQQALSACYERSLMNNPSLAGRIAFDWTVVKNGTVKNVRIRSSTLASPQVAACISDLIKRWKFPHPQGGDVVITFPFLFRSG